MILVLLLAGVMSLQAAPPADFESDLWPGEGRPIVEAVAPRLRLHELPSESSKVVETLIVPRRQRLAFDEFRYRTMKAGRFLALTATTVTGRRLGAIIRFSREDYESGTFGPASVAVVAGDRIEYLQYRAEGTCYIRLAGSVIDAAPCPTEKKDEFRLEARPVVEEWIHIVDGGNARGWLRLTDTTAKIVGRTG